MIDKELESYFIGFNDLLQQLESCADNLVTEYLERTERKLEDYVSILFGMICQSEIGESTEHRNDVLEPLKVLYELSYEKLEEISQKIIMEQASIDQGSGYYVPLEKTGGRPKFVVTKEQLLNFRETGMTGRKLLSV